MVRVWTNGVGWPEGQVLPALPTGEVDEEGEALYYPPLYFGPPAKEFPLPEGEDPETWTYGRSYTEDGRFNETQLLALSTVTDMHITRAGTFSNPTWPFPDEE